MWPGLSGDKSRSARRDQQAVNLDGLGPAEQVDLFRPECADLTSLGGLPELDGDAHADGIARAIGLPDERGNEGTSAAGKATTKSFQAGPGSFRLVVTEETAAEVTVTGLPTRR